MKKKLLALLLAGTMTFSLAAPSAAWAGIVINKAQTEMTETETSAADAQEETDYHLGITTERSLRTESGKSLSEWDQMVSSSKKSGMDAALTEEDLADTEILKKDDVVYYIGESRKLAPVMSADDAYERVYQVLPLLGGSEDTDLRLAMRLAYGDNHIYTFQQISDGEALLGSVVKVAVMKDGAVSAIFSGLKQDSTKKEKLITEEEAAEIVKAYMSKMQGIETDVLTEYTDRINFVQTDMAEALNLDIQGDPVPKLVLWVLYTENPSASTEYPYLAHYLRLDGTYEFSLPVAFPGNEESLTGYRKQDVFENMTADTYTGEVKDKKGNTREITVPVMHSEEDDKWYLGDVANRIAVADFATAAYSPEHKLVLVSSETNADWDNEDLYLFYNYLRAYEFYKGLGWDGPDGLGTDAIIMKNLCTSSGEAYLNACSIGAVENYTMFGYTGYQGGNVPLGLVEGLDVLGHEFTHTFTGTVMNDNLYENDLGAINEAMSDIMGNLIEFTCDDTDDTEWMLGENTGSPIRNMSDPHSYAQPEHVWDIYYGPWTETPSDANDRGGVHINSSLLNRIAALLVMKEGMSHEEAIRFWTAVAMGMTPRTDYREIGALLRWALRISGNDAYQEALNTLIEEAQLDRTELPETLPIGEKIFKLRIPDNKVFEDPNWGMIMVQLNMDTVSEVVDAAVSAAIDMFTAEEDQMTYGDFLQQLIQHLHLDGKELRLDNLDGVDPEKMEELSKAIEDLWNSIGSKLVIQTMAWREAGSDEITFVSENNPTLYLLINVTESGTKINGAAVLLGDRWVDIGSLMNVMNSFSLTDQGISTERKSSEETSDEQQEDVWTEEQMNNLEKFLSEFIDAYFSAGMEEEDDVQTESKKQKEYDLIDLIGGNIFNLIDYFLTDEENRTKSLEQIFTIPVETVYLPTKGLASVQLGGLSD